MFQLNPVADKEEYKAHSGQTVLLGDKEVEVMLDRVDTKSGSWERGFKFGSITYGILKKKLAKRGKYYQPVRYSCDHGRTWHEDVRAAKKSKGKTIVARSSSKEFAFDSIQKINRDYNPNYKWKP